MTTLARSARVPGVETPLGHYIGGEWVASSETFTDRCPIDDRPLAAVAAPQNLQPITGSDVR